MAKHDCFFKLLEIQIQIITNEECTQLQNRSNPHKLDCDAKSLHIPLTNKTSMLQASMMCDCANHAPACACLRTCILYMYTGTDRHQCTLYHTSTQAPAHSHMYSFDCTCEGEHRSDAQINNFRYLKSVTECCKLFIKTILERINIIAFDIFST